MVRSQKSIGAAVEATLAARELQSVTTFFGRMNNSFDFH